MQGNIIADRYAEALLNLEDVAISQLEADLAFISDILTRFPEIKEFFISPRIKPADKKKVIQKIFGDKFNQISLNLLMLLIDNKRGSELEDVYDQFVIRADRKLNRFRVNLNLPKQFSPETYSKIIQQTIQLIQKNHKNFYLNKVDENSQFQFITRIDEQMLGGIRIRIGDQYLDASLKHYLENWKVKILQKDFK